jgi:hypothetical protein
VTPGGPGLGAGVRAVRWAPHPGPAPAFPSSGAQPTRRLGGGVPVYPARKDGKHVSIHVCVDGRKAVSRVSEPAPEPQPGASVSARRRDGGACGKARPPSRERPSGSLAPPGNRSDGLLRKRARRSRRSRIHCTANTPRSGGRSGAGARGPGPGASAVQRSYLVDPASSHMLVSKIKPCMSKYKQFIL